MSSLYSIHYLNKIFSGKSGSCPAVALAATRAAAPNNAARGSSDSPPCSWRRRSSTPEARAETRMAGGKDLFASSGKRGCCWLASFLSISSTSFAAHHRPIGRLVPWGPDGGAGIYGGSGAGGFPHGGSLVACGAAPRGGGSGGGGLQRGSPWGCPAARRLGAVMIQWWGPGFTLARRRRATAATCDCV